MSQEVDRVNNLVHRLLEFARPAQPQLRPIRLSKLANEMLDFLQGTLLQKHVQVETVFGADDEVLADAGQLKQVFLNILLNSADAMSQGGRIAVSTARRNGYLEVAVADTGPGIQKKD